MKEKPLTKIGILGDIHAEPEYLQKAVTFLRQAQVEQILCSGDLADGPGDVNACCRILADNEIVCARGNHDRWLLNNEMRDFAEATLPEQLTDYSKSYLSNLPATVVIPSILGNILLCHGIGRHDMRKLLPDDFGYALQSNFELQEIILSRKYAVMVHGHTHRTMVRSIDGVVILNGGTLYRKHQPGFLIVDFSQPLVQLYTFDERAAINLQRVNPFPADEKVFRFL